ncbi:hypothetical protein [Micromonospora zamorensis]|uniref:hypothetical protein n=1 Tax=Micromonospora zamorensis TaxID=709883 RepID=UPI003CF78D0C
MLAMNGMVASLQLAYPPVSNQEAERVISEQGVVDRLRKSDFYMIAMRAEARFSEFRHDDEGLLHFKISTGTGISDSVTLHPSYLASNIEGIDPENGEITILGDEKVLKFYDGTAEDVDAGTAELFEWFSTEKLIYDRGHRLPGIFGFHGWRDFATYELLYVGIASKADTYQRLFQRAHRKRQQILSNEWPRTPGSRVTDEMYLFPLRVQPMTVRMLEPGDTFSHPSDEEWKTYCKRVTKDAEKAFVHLLDPQYNEVDFDSYPHSSDGLWEQGHERYIFYLAENLTFTTPTVTLHGAWDPIASGGNDADLITIEGESVHIRPGGYRQGLDGT